MQTYEPITANPGDDPNLASPRYAASLVAAKLADKKRAEESMAALDAAPPSMTLSDQEGWAKIVAANQDGYGAGIVRYAERWARMMEAKLATGQTLKDCANVLSHTADTEGITGAMYGAAVSILSQVWVYGAGLMAALR